MLRQTINGKVAPTKTVGINSCETSPKKDASPLAHQTARYLGYWTVI
jgi:hypothetical protein